VRLRIQQILPAPGWYAMYARDAQHDWEKARAVDLICWALVEEYEAHQSLRGMVLVKGRVAMADQQPGFLGYAGTNDATAEAWVPQARAWLERHRNGKSPGEDSSEGK